MGLQMVVQTEDQKAAQSDYSLGVDLAAVKAVSTDGQMVPPMAELTAYWSALQPAALTAVHSVVRTDNYLDICSAPYSGPQ